MSICCSKYRVANSDVYQISEKKRPSRQKSTLGGISEMRFEVLKSDLLQYVRSFNCAFQTVRTPNNIYSDYLPRRLIRKYDTLI